jgi:hypothetical protein
MSLLLLIIRTLWWPVRVVGSPALLGRPVLWWSLLSATLALLTASLLTRPLLAILWWSLLSAALLTWPWLLSTALALLSSALSLLPASLLTWSLLWRSSLLWPVLLWSALLIARLWPVIPVTALALLPAAILSLLIPSTAIILLKGTEADLAYHINKCGFYFFWLATHHVNVLQLFHFFAT